MEPGGIVLSPWIAVGLIIFLWIKLGRRARKKIDTALVDTAWSVIRWIGLRLWFLIVLTTFAIKLGIGLRLALRLQTYRWDAMVDARKLSGLKRGWVSRTPAGISVRLHLGGALRVPDVSRKLGQIEAGLGIKRGSARIKPLSRADRCDLQIVLRDPLAKPVPWDKPRGRVRFADPVRLSVTPFGDTIEISMKQRLGIFGTSGSGKSVVQRNLAAHVILSEDAQLDLWDLKWGTESQHFEGKAHRVITPEEAWARTEWLINSEMPRRAKIMKEVFRSSNWIESPEHPAMVIMVDEGNEITRGFTEGQLEKFFRVAEQGRALGIFLVWATQFPKATNLPTELRSQLNGWIVLQLLKAGEARVIFESDVDEGWTPHKLPGQGWLLIKDDRHRDPEESRSIFLDEDRFREIKPVGDLPPDTGQSAGQTMTMTREQKDKIKPSVEDDVWTVIAVAGAPMSISEIARQTGRSKAQVHTVVHRMAATGKITNHGKGWTLPIKED